MIFKYIYSSTQSTTASDNSYMESVRIVLQNEYIYFLYIMHFFSD